MGRPEEAMRAVKSETSRFLAPINQSVNIPEIPFSEKQVDKVRYYRQYAGADAEYVPPGLTLEDLVKLGKVDSSLFSVRNYLTSPVTQGGWVVSLYGLVLETVGLERKLCDQHHSKLLESFGLPNALVDFGNALDHIYLKLLVLNRTGVNYLGSNVIWTNDVVVNGTESKYMIIAYSPRLGFYVQLRSHDQGPDIGSSPLIYLTDPAARPSK